MADLDEQLPLEALVKIITCLGVGHFRSYKRRLTLAKRYSDDFSAFFRLVLQDEITEPKYCNLVVRFRAEDGELPDPTGIAIASCHGTMPEYRGVLGTICTCRAWFHAVEKIAAVCIA